MTVTVFPLPIVREPLSREQPLTVITSPVSSVKRRYKVVFYTHWFDLKHVPHFIVAPKFCNSRL